MAEREIAEPDWDLVRDRLDDDEKKVDACKGWSVGGRVDHPCAMYLTDRSICVDIRPDASIVGAETIVIPFSTVERCGLAANDQGNPRLAVLYNITGDAAPKNVRGVGVDLRPADRGWPFGRRVVDAIEIKDLQTRYAHLNATFAPVLAEAQEMTSIQEALAQRGAAIDPELNARVKRELGVPDTPFNT